MTNEIPDDCVQCKQIPVITCNATEAEQAFAVYSALFRLSVDDRELGKLPLMEEIRQIVFDRFRAAFELLP